MLPQTLHARYQRVLSNRCHFSNGRPGSLGIDACQASAASAADIIPNSTARLAAALGSCNSAWSAVGAGAG